MTCTTSLSVENYDEGDALITHSDKVFLIFMKYIVSDGFLLAKNEFDRKNGVAHKTFEKSEVKYAKKAYFGHIQANI